MTHALFVDPKGHYPKLLGEENCWDINRDARTYDGPGPVVCHPPCNLWVNMAAHNWKRYGRQLPAWYPGGHDEGCFVYAMTSLTRCGGVLEHPAFTHAWKKFGIDPPPSRKNEGVGWRRIGTTLWTCEVWQSAYGHRARKRTWLLYCGSKPPFELNWARPKGTHQVGWFDRIKPTLSKRESSATPVAFARMLIELAEHAT